MPVRFIGCQLRVLLHANDLMVYDGRTEVPATNGSAAAVNPVSCSTTTWRL
ncbi:hypothetical protein [Streptomyces griseoluteus]|uniref:hypothetical protein n=1 Tax=Streptomyces griseoluteus TaxID=29306 RepID=UPI00381CCE2A